MNETDFISILEKMQDMTQFFGTVTQQNENDAKMDVFNMEKIVKIFLVASQIKSIMERESNHGEEPNEQQFLTFLYAIRPYYQNDKKTIIDQFIKLTEIRTLLKGIDYGQE